MAFQISIESTSLYAFCMLSSRSDRYRKFRQTLSERRGLYCSGTLDRKLTPRSTFLFGSPSHSASSMPLSLRHLVETQKHQLRTSKESLLALTRRNSKCQVVPGGTGSRLAYSRGISTGQRACPLEPRVETARSQYSRVIHSDSSRLTMIIPLTSQHNMHAM